MLIRLLILLISMSSALASAEIPATLIELSTLKDKNNIEYQLLAYKAGVDTVNSGVNALEGMNSAEALKILSMGLKYMSHRNDIRNLRNKALGTYISITKKLEENLKQNCEILVERYDFLKEVAPDGLSEVKNDRSCLNIAALEQHKPEAKKKGANIFEVPLPRINLQLEKNYKADISKTFDYFLQKNNNFPSEDILNNMFMLFVALYGEDFQVDCQDFVPNPDATNKNDLTVGAKCERINVTSSNLKEVQSQYDKNLKDLLEVPEGKESIDLLHEGTKISTSKPLFTKWTCLMSEGDHCRSNSAPLDGELYGINKRLPECVIMDRNLIYKDSIKKSSFVAFMAHKEFIPNPSSFPSFGPRNWDMTFSQYSIYDVRNCFRPSTRSELSGGPWLYIDELARRHSIKAFHNFEGLSSDQLKGLQKITFTINYWETYNHYKNVLFEINPKNINSKKQR